MSPHQEAIASSTSSLIWGLKEFTDVVESPTRPWSSLICVETTPSIQVCRGAVYVVVMCMSWCCVCRGDVYVVVLCMSWCCVCRGTLHAVVPCMPWCRVPCMLRMSCTCLTPSLPRLSIFHCMFLLIKIRRLDFLRRYSLKAEINRHRYRLGGYGRLWDAAEAEDGHWVWGRPLRLRETAETAGGCWCCWGNVTLLRLQKAAATRPGFRTCAVLLQS